MRKRGQLLFMNFNGESFGSRAPTEQSMRFTRNEVQATPTARPEPRPHLTH